MYGNGYFMAIVFDHRSTATSLTGNHSSVECDQKRNLIHGFWQYKRHNFSLVHTNDLFYYIILQKVAINNTHFQRL